MENKNLSKEQLSNVREMRTWYCTVFYEPMIMPDDNGEAPLPPSEHYTVDAETATAAADKLHKDHPTAKQINCSENH